MGEALRDGDHVYAILKGSAINNDGGLKAGFTAKDDTFRWGQIGLGSFDDTSDWDTVKLTGTNAKKP